MPRSLLIRAALVVAMWAGSGALVHVGQIGSKAVQPSGIRIPVPNFVRAQVWFEIVRAHEIGERDESAKAIASMDPETLVGIRDDLRMIHNLLDVATTKHQTRVSLYGRVLNLISLAPLLGLTADELDLPGELTYLGDPENPARKVISRIMIRAAVLHTRVAMEPAEDVPTAPAAIPPGGLSRVGVQPVHSAVRVQDGQTITIADRSMHWAVAREALDIVGPPAAASSAVRAWYDATMAYLQSERMYSGLLPLLEHARVLFPNDPTVWLFSGAASENLAASKIQVAVLDASAGVGKPADLLQQAEGYLRRALELDPGLALAKLRLGRVMLLTHHDDEAVQRLQAAETSASTLEGRYLAALFLGRAEESGGRDEPARAAYLRAADLFAGAQSPRLALASMAWRRGERDEALSHLRVLAPLKPVDVFADPWWRYDVCHVGDIEALFYRLDAAVAKALR